jgi:DNA polymerase IV
MAQWLARSAWLGAARGGAPTSGEAAVAVASTAPRGPTLDAPIASTVTLAEVTEELVHKALAHHPDEKIISLLAISVSLCPRGVFLKS